MTVDMIHSCLANAKSSLQHSAASTGELRAVLSLFQTNNKVFLLKGHQTQGWVQMELIRLRLLSVVKIGALEGEKCWGYASYAPIISECALVLAGSPSFVMRKIHLHNSRLHDVMMPNHVQLDSGGEVGSTTRSVNLSIQQQTCALTSIP